MPTSHVVDLQIAHGDVLLVDLGITGSTNSETIPTDPSETREGILFVVDIVVRRRDSLSSGFTSGMAWCSG